MTRTLKFLFLAGLVLLATPLIAQEAPNEAALDALVMHNFVLGKPMEIDPSILTAESARDYVPQVEEALAMYDHFLSTGMEPFAALFKTYQEVLAVLQGELSAGQAQ